MARVTLSRMVQDRGEPIRSFAARLRGQAEVCMFTHKCPGCDRINNQGKQRVTDQLYIGLAEPEIQEDLLKDTNLAMSVEETIRFVEVRAAGKRSAISITSPTSPASAINEGGDQAEPINSGYRQRQRSSTPRRQAGPTTLHRCQTTHTKCQQSTPTQPIQNKGTKGNPSHANRLPMPKLFAVFVADKAMGSTPGQQSGCPAQPVTSRTIMRPCAGRTLSTRVPSGSRSPT